MSVKTEIKQTKAFSLIELLVVVAVLGILFSVVLPNLISSRSRARDVALKSDLNQLKSALRMYYNDYQTYPDDDGAGNMLACGNQGNSACPNENGSFGVSETIYMKEMPKITDFSYSQLDNGEGFLLTAALENASDQDTVRSAQKCDVNEPVDGTYYVCVE